MAVQDTLESHQMHYGPLLPNAPEPPSFRHDVVEVLAELSTCLSAARMFAIRTWDFETMGLLRIVIRSLFVSRTSRTIHRTREGTQPPKAGSYRTGNQRLQPGECCGTESSRAPVHAGPKSELRVIKGRCWVIDGDTIVIDKLNIRLAGIDAPELNHPWGRNSKAALMQMCKGQIISAELLPESTYDRAVAICYLPDGRDLAAELVRMGLAIDWPKFSGGRYRHLEPEGIRKKLWRADAKQKGRYDAKRHG